VRGKQVDRVMPAEVLVGTTRSSMRGWSPLKGERPARQRRVCLLVYFAHGHESQSRSTAASWAGQVVAVLREDDM